jgi:predicted esterase
VLRHLRIFIPLALAACSSSPRASAAADMSTDASGSDAEQAEGDDAASMDATGPVADGGVAPSKDAGSRDAGSRDAGPKIDAGPSSSRFTARPLGSVNGAPNGYWEYLPPGYDGTKATPILVFWHGIGEDGNGKSDLPLVRDWGPPELIGNNQWDSSRPFIVLSPQYTAAGSDIAPGSGCPSSAVVQAFLTFAIGHYDVDPKRVYLTGLSCGAIGSWDYLGNFQGTVVAAAVLLSGNPGDPTAPTSTWGRAGCSLGTASIWSFHGDADDTVPYAPDQATMADLTNCPSPPRRAAVFTDVKGGGHNIWDPIYDLSGGYGDIYAWMLTNAKP